MTAYTITPEKHVPMIRLSVYARDQDVFDALCAAFAGVDSVTVHKESICSAKADCIIAPGQSFGFMDGGADRAINSWMSSYSPMEPRFSEKAKAAVREGHLGELPVGSCLIVDAPAAAPVKCVAYAPTMRVPEPVSHTLNPYLALHAALTAIRNWPHRINTVACTALCTGAGEMPPARAARQMRAVWDGPRPTNWSEAWDGHRELLSM